MGISLPPSLRFKRGFIVSTLLMAVPVAAFARTSADDSVTVDTQRNVDGTTQNRYYLTFTTQTFDGIVTRSQMQKAGFARFRKDDESWVRIDLGDGTLVTQRPGELRARRIDGVIGAQTAVLYNYRTQTMSGNPGLSDFHNQYLRPLLDKSPPLGSDAKWTTDIILPKLGFRIGSAAAATVELSRHYFDYKNRKLVLVEYTIAKLDYTNAAGVRYAQSGHGVALADPAFGQVYWSSSLYVGKATGSARPRPYRYARTAFAMDRKGRALIDIRKIPELQPALAALYGASSRAPLPFVGVEENPDQLPLQVAAVTDVTAFAIVENSANQMAEDVATAIMGGGGMGQMAGSKIDAVLSDSFVNNVLIPATSAAGGAAKAEAATVIDAANAEVAAVKAQTTTLSKMSASVVRDMQAATAERAVIVQNLDNAFRASVAAGDIAKPDVTLMRALSAVNSNIQSLQAQTKTIALKALDNAAQVTKWEAATSRIADVVAAAKGDFSLLAKCGTLINGVRALSGGLTWLGYAANAEGIYKNVQSIRQFDPYAGGDLKLNGTYSGWMAGGEIVANLAALGGDIGSGNAKAVILDVANFGGGRISDILMAYAAQDAAHQQALQAEIALNLTELARAQQLARNGMASDVASINAESDRIGKELAALTAQLGMRTSISAPDWQDPRINPDTGLPKPDYWAWLKANNPDKLRAMGIDPDAPVGGYPPKTQQAEVDMPRQPGVDSYPKRDPKTIKIRPKPDQSANAGTPAIPDGLLDTTTAPAQSPPLTRAAPVSAQADAAARQWAMQATNFVLDKFDLGSISFADDWSPVTWTPVTWTPPVWTPVTWTPPKWVPITFDAPKPSALPWTTISDGDQYPQTAGNMAYTYASIDGRVATDLSPYAGWLKTQNQAYVRQLAASAGYPNLASALADAANLMAHGSDAGFQQYAWGAPVADPFVSADIDQSQRLMARAQYTLGGMLLKSGMFTNAQQPQWQLSQQPWTGALPDGNTNPSLCGR